MEILNMIEEKEDSENPLSEKPCSSTQGYKQEIQAVEEQLVKHTQNCVRAAHHKKIIQTALTTRKPPKGLTPTFRVTAMGQTPQLSNKIDAILNECGLHVCTTLTEHYTEIITTNKAITDQLSERLKKIESMAKGTNNEEQIQTATAGAKQKAKQEGLSLANELLQRKRPAPTTPDTATEPPPPAKKSELEGLLLGLLEQNKVNTNPNPNHNPNNLTTTPPTAKRNLQRHKKRPRRQRQRKRPPLKLNRLKTKTYHKRIYKTKQKTIKQYI